MKPPTTFCLSSPFVPVERMQSAWGCRELTPHAQGVKPCCWKGHMGMVPAWMDSEPMATSWPLSPAALEQLPTWHQQGLPSLPACQAGACHGQRLNRTLHCNSATSRACPMLAGKRPLRVVPLDTHFCIHPKGILAMGIPLPHHYPGPGPGMARGRTAAFSSFPSPAGFGACSWHHRGLIGPALQRQELQCLTLV